MLFQLVLTRYGGISSQNEFPLVSYRVSISILICHPLSLYPSHGICPNPPFLSGPFLMDRVEWGSQGNRVYIPSLSAHLGWSSVLHQL